MEPDGRNHAEGGVMARSRNPPGGQGPADDAGNLRDLVDESRQAVAQVLNFRSEFEDLKEAIRDLTRAIRGGDGEQGLTTVTSVMDARIRSVEGQLAALSAQGAPASQAELRGIHSDLGAVRTDLASLRADIGETKIRQADGIRRIGELERLREKGVSRGWQITGLVSAFVVGGLGLLASVALVVVEVLKR